MTSVPAPTMTEALDRAFKSVSEVDSSLLRIEVLLFGACPQLAEKSVEEGGGGTHGQVERINAKLDYLAELSASIIERIGNK